MACAQEGAGGARAALFGSRQLTEELWADLRQALSGITALRQRSVGVDKVGVWCVLAQSYPIAPVTLL
jgi:hypothetical protein